MVKILRLWAPVVLVGWVIYFLSSIPSLGTGWGIWDFILRKGAHITEFFLFTYFLMRAVTQTWENISPTQVMLGCACFAIFYAILDEYHQSFVPGRGPSVQDVMVDAVGVLMVIVLYKSKWNKVLFKLFLWVFIVGASAGCGSQAQFKSARKLEQKGKYYEAWQKYQLFAAQNPADPKAPEALFRAGWLVQMNLKDCHVAKTFFDRVMSRYPQSIPWANMAGIQKENCPDFFPLLPGSRWVEGDSDSKGDIARTETECHAIENEKKGFPSEKGMMVTALFAGDKKVQTIKRVYRKKESELREYVSASDPRYKVLLNFPITVGEEWSTKSDKKTYRYKVLADNLKVKVAAGEFENCVKVRSFVEGASGSATNDYYAPGVGQILKTVSTSKTENRITELISYKLAAWPDLTVNEEIGKSVV